MPDTETPTAKNLSLRRRSAVLRAFAVGLGCLGALSGCVQRAPVAWVQRAVPSHSPGAVEAAPGVAWREAQAIASRRVGSEVVVGLGDSMLPLYLNRTLLVTERVPFHKLKAGMTVVFDGEGGGAVAHCLVRPTVGGWETAGLANAQPDPEPVTTRNYRGVVIRAYALTDPRKMGEPNWIGLREPPDREGTANLAAAGQ